MDLEQIKLEKYRINTLICLMVVCLSAISFFGYNIINKIDESSKNTTIFYVVLMLLSIPIFSLLGDRINLYFNKKKDLLKKTKIN